jgi:hypothetical protein
MYRFIFTRLTTFFFTGFDSNGDANMPQTENYVKKKRLLFGITQIPAYLAMYQI